MLDQKDKVISKYRELNNRLDEGETNTLIDDFRTVVDEMEECIDLNAPVILGAFRNMADLYFNVGDYKQAAVYLEKTKESLSQHIGFWFLKLGIYFELISIYKKIEDKENYSKILKEIGCFIELLNEEEYLFEMHCYGNSGDEVYKSIAELRGKLNELDLKFDLRGDECGGNVGFLVLAGEKIPVFKWSYSQFESDYIIYLDIEAKEGLLEKIHKCFLSSEGAACEVYYGNFKGYKGKGRIVGIEGSEYQTQYLGNLIQIQLCGESSPEIM